MPKVKTDAVHRHFTYDEETNYSQCTHCPAKLKGHHATNLKNHMSVKHKDKLKDVITIKEPYHQHNQSQNQNRKDNLITDIKNICVKLVTFHGRPLEMVEDVAFQELIDMIVPTNKSVNIKSIESMFAHKCYDIRSKIATELRSKLLCVKLDSATYQDRSFFGINVQYIKNGTVIIRNLAVQEVFEPQTGEFLKNTLLDVFADYQIDAEQIYCITTDNGKILKKLANLLGGSYEPVDIDQEEDENNSETEEEDDNNESDSKQDIVIEALMTALREDPPSNFTPRTMLCAAHTLQLAIKDFIESNPEVEDVLFRVRQVVKILRRPTMRNILKRANLNKTIIDCPTRWSSTYNMLERIQSLKSICLNDENIMSRIDEAEWEKITELVDCLKPCFIATLKLQREHLTLGDFFIEWLTCKGYLESRRTEISQSLLECMKTREVNLLRNNIMLEALYLDTRLNVMLSDQEAARAQQLLKETYDQINNIKLKSNDPNLAFSSFNTNDDPLADPLAGSSGMQNQQPLLDNDNANMSYVEEILKITEHERRITKLREGNSITTLLKEIRNIPRLPVNENIIKYWDNKLSSPELRELALCVLATPATQVSIESLFSSVKYIFSPHRSNLNQSTLANIMVIRSNRDLYM